MLPTPAGIAREQLVRQRLLDRLDVVARQAGVQAAHAAGDVEADAARGHDAALVRVEGRHAADGEAVAPVRIGHGVGRADDARAASRR